MADAPVTTISEPAPSSSAAVPRDATGTITNAPEPKAAEAAPEASKTPEPKGDKTLLNGEQSKVTETTYADFKVPEGYTLDAEVAKEAGDLFKGMNLSQDQAQSLVDFYVKKTTESAEAPFKLWTDTQKEWRDAVAAKHGPPDGTRFQQISSTISRAIDGLGPQLASQFREAMDITGAGNNPAFIDAFYALAQRLNEGGHVAGGGPSPGGQRNPNAAPASPASAMYPNLPTSSR